MAHRASAGSTSRAIARRQRVTAPTYRTKRDYAVAWIRQAILTGELEPGRHIRQEELVRELKISPTPIREAIRVLEAEGVLRTRPHRDVTVASLSGEELLEVYWARVGLESVAARLAVSVNEPDETTRLAARLQRLQDEMERRFRAGQAHRVPELNMRFHFALIEASRSPLLLKMCRQLWVNLPHHFFWQRPARARTALEQHDAIVRAVASGEANATEAAMRAHVQWAAETLDVIHDARELTSPPHYGRRSALASGE